MKRFVQVTCIATGLKVLDDRPLLFGIARGQERRSIICKHRRTKKRKRKYTSLFMKYLQTAFLKAIAIAIGFHALEKRSH